jgi:antirestriction protein
MQIYVECVESRKNDLSRGEWVDVEQTEEEIDSDIQFILDKSPVDSKGFVITDSKGFYPLKIPEKISIDELVVLVNLVEEHGNAYLHYVNYVGIDNATEKDFLEAYMGEWDSEEKFAENLMDECYNVPDDIASYIDYASFAYDLFIDDYYMLNDCYVFRSY